MAARKPVTGEESGKRPDRRGPRTTKRGDRVAEQVKGWITEGRLRPGVKLEKEAELQQMFNVSRGSVRDALKALEVQGLVSLSTGPDGGATITRVPLERAFVALQNHLFFEGMGLRDLYAVRRALEPMLAAGAVPYLTEADLQRLEHSVAVCEPFASTDDDALDQRREDLHFHDILAAANPNALLRCLCQIINQMLQNLVSVAGNVTQKDYQAFGQATAVAHRAILDAARERDADSVHRLMLEHMEQAEAQLHKVHAALQQKLVLDSELGLYDRRRAGD